MAKTLKQMLEVYKPKAADEQKFADKHVAVKHDDRNGNKDDVFQGTNVKPVDRKKERHGYTAGEDEKVYEEAKCSCEESGKAKCPVHGMKKEEVELDEKLSPSQGAGEYVKDFTKSKAPQFKGKSKEKRRVMAIAAYLGAKNKTNEEVEQVDELNKSTLGSYINKASKDSTGHGFNLGKSIANKDWKAGGDAGDKANKRLKGIAKATNKLTKEETELQESDESHAQFQKYHNDAAGLLKKIHTGLSKHYDNVTNKKSYNNGQATWGHVGDIKSIHRQLQDLHDQILQHGDWAKPIQVTKEDVEMDARLLGLYANLDEENKASMVKMIEEGKTADLIEFVEMMESNNG